MDLDQNIEDYDLVFLDLETTGLDVVTGDAICEIGAFKIKARQVVDKFHSLVNPQRPMPQEAYRVHKIPDQELKTAPKFEEIVDKLLVFLKGSVFCAYNVEFDLGFIDYSLKKIDYSTLEAPALDILVMARDALTLPRYNLEKVARSLDIDCRAGLHRALEDASIAYQIFFKLIDIFKEKGIDKLNDFMSLYSYNNAISRAKQNQKIALLEEAISNNFKVSLKHFSSNRSAETEDILPLRIFTEGRSHYLLCQGSGENPFRISLRRILDIESISDKINKHK
jgi:DNA polymerase III epsilon subunit family exonuclease